MRRATATRWIDDLRRYLDLVAIAPERSATAIGHRLIEAGVVVSAAGAPFSQSVIAIGFAMTGLGAVLARPPLTSLPGFLLGLGFTAWVAFSVVFTVVSGRDPHPLKHLGLLYGWTQIHLVLVACARPQARRWAWWAFASAICASAAVAAAQFAIGYDRLAPPWRIATDGAQHARVSGLLSGALPFGTIAGFALLAGLWWTGRDGPRLASWLAAAAAVGSVVLSGSRLPLLATGPGLMWYAWSVPRRGWAIAGLGALLAVGAMSVMISNPERIANTFEARDGRIYIWRVAISFIREHPLVGLGGRAAFKARYHDRWVDLVESRETDLVQREPEVEHAHNTVLGLASEHGLPAALLHLGLLAALGLGLRGAAGNRLGWSAIAAWLIGGQFNYLAGSNETTVAFTCCLGFAYGSALDRAEVVAVLQPASDRVVGEAPAGADQA